MRDETSHVIERFPALAASIKQCLCDSRTFRSLCEEYDLAAEALRYWQIADAPRRRSRGRSTAVCLANSKAKFVPRSPG